MHRPFEDKETYETYFFQHLLLVSVNVLRNNPLQLQCWASSCSPDPPGHETRILNHHRMLHGFWLSGMVQNKQKMIDLMMFQKRQFRKSWLFIDRKKRFILSKYIKMIQYDHDDDKPIATEHVLLLAQQIPPRKWHHQSIGLRRCIEHLPKADGLDTMSLPSRPNAWMWMDVTTVPNDWHTQLIQIADADDDGTILTLRFSTHWFTLSPFCAWFVVANCRAGPPPSTARFRKENVIDVRQGLWILMETPEFAVFWAYRIFR